MQSTPPPMTLASIVSAVLIKAFAWPSWRSGLDPLTLASLFCNALARSRTSLTVASGMPNTLRSLSDKSKTRLLAAAVATATVCCARSLSIRVNRHCQMATAASTRAAARPMRVRRETRRCAATSASASRSLASCDARSCICRASTTVDEVMEAMRSDKKVSGGRPKFVLLDGLGRSRWGVDLPDARVHEVVKQLLAGDL